MSQINRWHLFECQLKCLFDKQMTFNLIYIFGAGEHLAMMRAECQKAEVTTPSAGHSHSDLSPAHRQVWTRRSSWLMNLTSHLWVTYEYLSCYSPQSWGNLWSQTNIFCQARNTAMWRGQCNKNTLCEWSQYKGTCLPFKNSKHPCIIHTGDKTLQLSAICYLD